MVGRPLVIDASAALSIVRDEESSDAVRHLIARHGERPLLVPDVFWIEISNVLVRRYELAAQDVLDAIAMLDSLGLITVQASRAGLLQSVAVMIERTLSAYDAAYLALVETHEADLLSLDRRLIASAGNRAIALDDEHVRERRTEYRLQPWITWEEAAEYFGAVRRTLIEEGSGEARWYQRFPESR